MIFPDPVFRGIGFRRLLCRDYVFTVPGTIPGEMRSYFCRQKGRGGGCSRSYFSLSVFLIRRFHLYRFLFYSLVSRQSLAHKLHTEWFVAIPGETQKKKEKGKMDRRKFISKSGCTRLKCFFPNAKNKNASILPTRFFLFSPFLLGTYPW